MQTRRQWWWSVILSLLGALSVSTGIALLVTSRTGLEWLVGLFAVGAGALLWRLSLPMPASVADVALLTSAPRVAKGLAREHTRRSSFLQGILTGALIATLLAIMALW